jgi:hypothetical protein
MRYVLAVAAAAVAFVADTVVADVYMHYPPGSNNRCDEKNNNRQNAQKLFDSENNAAGGYNWPGNFTKSTFDSESKQCMKEDQHYIYSDTFMNIVWTSQHGCGKGNECNIVLQMGYKHSNSMPNLRDGRPELPGITFTGQKTEDGGGSACRKTPPAVSYDTIIDCVETFDQASCVTNQRQFNGENLQQSDFEGEEDEANQNAQVPPNAQFSVCTYGEHEPYENFEECYDTMYNEGLWIANENLNKIRGAMATRQNNNGQRHGYECSEERDYFPYWRKNPWVTFAYLSSRHAEECENVDGIFNNADIDRLDQYCKCDGWNLEERKAEAESNGNGNNYKYYKYPQSKDACEIIGGGTWVCGEEAGYITHRKALDDFGLSNWDMHCGPVPSSHPNTLASASAADFKTHHNNGAENDYATYQWRVPSVSQPMDFTVRIRYNITTTEVNDIDASFNDDDSPIYDDEYLVTPENVMMRIAVKENQLPRGFEDRSYVWQLRPRDDAAGSCAFAEIANVNVMGKRGNIAQVRNCIEYFFVPRELDVNQDDCIHFQFFGSDYNANGNDGEGKNGSDRSNLVAVTDPDVVKFSTKADQLMETFFDPATAVMMAEVGQNTTNPDECYTPQECGILGGQIDTCGEQDYKNCALLNRAEPYFDTGPIAVTAGPGSYHFMSTRNNNFSNRDQKMTIHVGMSNVTIGIVATASAVVGIGAIAGLVFFLYKRGMLKGTSYKKSAGSSELSNNANRI